MQTHQILVESTGAAFEQRITAGPHHLVSDEPAAFGGTDAGATPYDLLLGALGACTSMTVGMYARRKQWPLQRVSVALAHTREHAEDCVNCEEPARRIDRIEVRLRLEGPLTDEQRARLTEIAGHCPVHRTLTGKIDIRTTLE